MSKSFKEQREEIDRAMKKMSQDVMEALIFGVSRRGFSQYGRYGDADSVTIPDERLYSSILGKYIDPKTGEPIEEK